MSKPKRRHRLFYALDLTNHKKLNKVLVAYAKSDHDGNVAGAIRFLLQMYFR